MKKLVAGIVGLLGALALSGCSPAGGTAAIVNGVSIPDSKVSTWAHGCAISLQNSGTEDLTEADLRLQAVQWAIIDQLSRDYLESAGWNVSEDELRELVLSNPSGAALLHNEECTEAAFAVARHNTIMMRLGENTDEYLGAPDIQVNPRYGVWDPANLQPVDTASLSTMADR